MGGDTWPTRSTRRMNSAKSAKLKSETLKAEEEIEKLNDVQTLAAV